MDRGVNSFRELVSAFRGLGIQRSRPVIAHASLSAFGAVPGGAETVLGAMLAAFDTVMMPAFTFKTMLTPESGPPDNGIEYGREADHNRMAVFYEPEMAVDRLMGAVAEALRRHPLGWRSPHPILSFVGIGIDDILDAQGLAEPLAPIGKLAEAEGWVLLLGVDHTVNTSIHYAECLAGRKQFIRWALTPEGVVECPGFPGCSQGFQAIAPDLDEVMRKTRIGEAQIQAMPLGELIVKVRLRLASDPMALLCSSPDCLRCRAVRAGE
jgi:aminoglycoside 3-N-acetyltransferase